jgi:hypothetical protein
MCVSSRLLADAAPLFVCYCSLRFSAADSSVSVGWGWGGSKFLGYGNNNVSFNRMKRVMTKLRDGGGIYVNGWTNPLHRNTVLLFSALAPFHA